MLSALPCLSKTVLPFPVADIPVRTDSNCTGAVIAIGDVHGDWDALNSILERYKPSAALVVGDMGFFPRPPFTGMDPRSAVNTTLSSGQKVEVRFCDGNHEDHESLKMIVGDNRHTPCEIAENLFYQPRGSLCALPDGRAVLFAGGAKSVDRRARVEGATWFPQEILKRQDLPRELPIADVVVSHTAPRVFGLQTKLGLKDVPAWWDVESDPSELVLDEVLERVAPPVWVCGHWHTPYSAHMNTTTVHVLDCLRQRQLSQDSVVFI